MKQSLMQVLAEAERLNVEELAERADDPDSDE